MYHTGDNEMRSKNLNPLRFSRTPNAPLKEAPDLGQHNETVLQTLAGYTVERVERLRAEGVTGVEE